MKRLFVLRHAKSSWEEADLTDFDRPLNDRGLKAAPLMGKLMRDRNFLPQIILSSPAKRARQTVELVQKAGHLDAELKFDKRIYEADPRTLAKIVSELDDGLETALLVGHNPGIEGLVRFLTGSTVSMPTAALAVIDLDIDGWRETGEGRGSLSEIIRPKEAEVSNTFGG